MNTRQLFAVLSLTMGFTQAQAAQLLTPEQRAAYQIASTTANTSGPLKSCDYPSSMHIPERISQARETIIKQIVAVVPTTTMDAERASFAQSEALGIDMNHTLPTKCEDLLSTFERMEGLIALGQ